MKVVINYLRIGKPVARYVEGLVEDDGRRVRTATDVSGTADFRPAWIAKGEQAAVVRKYLFYQHHFAVMELRNASGHLLGYYCDVVSKLEKRGDEYFLKDLFLDLWIAPDGSVRELDWDEFRDACARGILSGDEERCAVETFERSRARRARAGSPPSTSAEAEGGSTGPARQDGWLATTHRADRLLAERGSRLGSSQARA